jgi:hypothetical protein
MGKSGNPAKRAEQEQEKNENIILAWCDNGLVDGKFMEGVVYTLLTTDVPVRSAIRVQGNQIGRQRNTALKLWYEQTNFDWILWVDSDIVITNEVINKLWYVAKKENLPIISGTYFISKENEQSIMQPFPALFVANPLNKFEMGYVHPMPENAVVPVDYAGFGLLLMHRSVIDKMIAHHGDNVSFFIETTADGGSDAQFISEDIRFFMMMKEAGVQLHGHTGALVRHMKRFSFDVDFYKLYWGTAMKAHEDAKKAGS